jgi:membrane protein
VRPSHFYAATSLAPVLLIVVAVAGLVFGQDATRGAIGEELGQLLGPTGGEFIKSILDDSAIRIRGPSRHFSASPPC